MIFVYKMYTELVVHIAMSGNWNVLGRGIQNWYVLGRGIQNLHSATHAFPEMKLSVIAGI
jgi:hypothetical protein